MIENLSSEVQTLLDRQEIYKRLTDYCRGQDRIDSELSHSVFHSDAILDYGGFVGPLHSFVIWGESVVGSFYKQTLHCITNVTYDLKANSAHTETYFIMLGIKNDGQREIRAGRYIDRFEKRNSSWAIAARICTLDCDEPQDDAGKSELGINNSLFVEGGRGDSSDPSYIRPLNIDRSRLRQAK